MRRISITNKKNTVVYKVHWERVGRYDANRNWEVKYENISGAPASSLGGFGSSKLLSGYGKRDRGRDGIAGNEDDILLNPTYYNNPISEGE